MAARGPDRLKTYRRKRRAGRTPEPGVAPSRARGLVRTLEKSAHTFVVHKHDATRLHYDLRLEIHGALASWAIPKGPTYDTKVRRLAVETEDHPLEYGSFEGRIPEGEYGAGDSLLWDRGTFETVPPGQAAAMKQEGHLHIVLHGEKLHGRWHLVRTRARGKAPQWLFFKAHDEYAEAGGSITEDRPESVASGRRITRGPVRQRERLRPHPPPLDLLLKVWPPMLATLARADAALRDEDYAFEVKYDGFRALAALSARRVALQSRNGLDLAGRFPRVATAVATLDLPEAVLDGEIVALDRHGVGRFEELQAAGKELRYMVFDLLWLDGTDLRSRPLRDRRELLESALSQAQLPLAVAERLESTRAAALQTARSRKLEGMIAKRLDAPYVGARSRAWLKLKVQQSQELVAIGYEPISSGERAVGALLLAVADGRGRFSYAGKVGTGFDMATRRRLRTLLDAQHVDRPPVETRERLKEARWSRPKLVAEVRFTEWTRDGGLRHPVFAGLREDKSPQECVREAAD